MFSSLIAIVSGCTVLGGAIGGAIATVVGADVAVGTAVGGLTGAGVGLVGGAAEVSAYSRD